MSPLLFASRPLLLIPTPGHQAVAVVLLLHMVATVSLTVFYGRVMLVGRHTCCSPNILCMHKVVIINCIF